MGIRGQLAWLVPGVVALALVGFASFAAETQRRDELDEMLERNRRVLETVGITTAVYIAENDLSGLDTLVAHLTERGRMPDLLDLTVVDHEGRVLAAGQPERFNSVPDDDFIRRAVRSESSLAEREGQWLRISAPSVSGLRWATVVASYSLDRVDASVARMRARWLAMAGILSLVLGLGLFIALDRLVVRPVRVLQRTARRIGEGALDAQVPPLRTRELSELSGTVNRMAATLRLKHGDLERMVVERTRELREANERLQRLAVTDGLTGVFNHRRFRDLLDQEVLRSRRTGRAVSLLMLDVDHFKRVNDALGHPAGDALLRRLAATLSAELRAIDVLARYGGEEFAVLLPETSASEAAQVAERLRAAVERDLRIDSWQHPVTISVGVATFGLDGDTPESLVEAADRALYEAKRGGRNRVQQGAMGAEAR